MADGRLDDLVKRALKARAADAPAPGALANHARRRAARRQNVLVGGAALAVAAMIVPASLWATQHSAEPPAPTGQPNGQLPETVGAAKQWRWEHYGGVEVRVPADWEDGATGQSSVWCMKVGGTGDAPLRNAPYVGRPGIFLPALYCGKMPLHERVPFVEFHDGGDDVQPGVDVLGAGWIDTTVIRQGVAVTVRSNDRALTSKIIRSLRQVKDTHGCPPGSDVTGAKPVPPDGSSGGLATIGRVDSVAICHYPIGSGEDETLVWSGLLTGSEARDLVDRIQRSPSTDYFMCVAGGPNTATELHVRGDGGVRQVYVRYADCGPMGFQDGVVRRVLFEGWYEALQLDEINDG